MGRLLAMQDVTAHTSWHEEAPANEILKQLGNNRADHLAKQAAMDGEPPRHVLAEHEVHLTLGVAFLRAITRHVAAFPFSGGA